MLYLGDTTLNLTYSSVRERPRDGDRVGKSLRLRVGRPFAEAPVADESNRLQLLRTTPAIRYGPVAGTGCVPRSCPGVPSGTATADESASLLEKIGVGGGQPKGDCPRRSGGDDSAREITRFRREAAIGALRFRRSRPGAYRTLDLEEAFDRPPEIFGLDELPVRVANPGPQIERVGRAAVRRGGKCESRDPGRAASPRRRRPSGRPRARRSSSSASTRERTPPGPGRPKPPESWSEPGASRHGARARLIEPRRRRPAVRLRGLVEDCAVAQASRACRSWGRCGPVFGRPRWPPRRSLRRRRFRSDLGRQESGPGESPCGRASTRCCRHDLRPKPLRGSPLRRPGRGRQGSYFTNPTRVAGRAQRRSRTAET